MSISLDDSKRIAIACKLADMKQVQNLLIANEEILISACSDDDICDRLRSMLEDDCKNLGILDTVIVQYGVQSEPKETVKQLTEKISQSMEGSELSLYEKVSQHELLKHQQVMSGLLVHKAAQVVGADVEAAIIPLNAIAKRRYGNLRRSRAHRPRSKTRPLGKSSRCSCSALRSGR
jgi:hypothetical protein